MTDVMIPTTPEAALQLGSEFDPPVLVVPTIQTVADCQAAVDTRKILGEQIKKVQAYFEPLKSVAFKLHRAITQREGDVLRPIQALDAAYRDEIQRYDREQQRIRRDEEARLAKEAREAEQTRLAAAAAELESAGESALAAAVIEQAIAMPPSVVVLPSLKRQVDGLKTRKEYRWRYANGGTAATAIKILPREWLCVDEQKLGAYARAMKGQAVPIPGIEFYEDEVPVR